MVVGLLSPLPALTLELMTNGASASIIHHEQIFSAFLSGFLPLALPLGLLYLSLDDGTFYPPSFWSNWPTKVLRLILVSLSLSLSYSSVIWLGEFTEMLDMDRQAGLYRWKNIHHLNLQERKKCLLEIFFVLITL